MPKGPKGQKRSADVTSNAVKIARIATGEIEELSTSPAKRNAGKKGSMARAIALTPAQRSEIARTAAQARWKKKS